MIERQKKSSTRSFGSGSRISHNSDKFYDSKLYDNIKTEKKINYTENPISENFLDKIYNSSSENMAEIPDNSVHLMVTSPPYNVSKDYDQNLSLEEYLNLLSSVFSETYRVLVTGGRACINIANIGRKPYIPLHSYVVEEMHKIGFLMRGEIIWNKSASSGGSTAWGSWQSPSNPCLRDVHEYILVFCKESFTRKPPIAREKTVSRDDFLTWTKSVWEFQTVSAKKIGHPAPFPEELPRRLIQLYTYKDEIVLDPFCGSGTSCVAAISGDRRYIGYEINSDYVRLAEERLNNYNNMM